MQFSPFCFLNMFFELSAVLCIDVSPHFFFHGAALVTGSSMLKGKETNEMWLIHSNKAAGIDR